MWLKWFELVLDMAENIQKGENADYQYFLFYSYNVFKMFIRAGSSNLDCVVKSYNI